jgi:hypothetical protein
MSTGQADCCLGCRSKSGLKKTETTHAEDACSDIPVADRHQRGAKEAGNEDDP